MDKEPYEVILADYDVAYREISRPPQSRKGECKHEGAAFVALVAAYAFAGWIRSVLNTRKVFKMHLIVLYGTFRSTCSCSWR